MILSDVNIEIEDTENVQMVLIPNRTLGILNKVTSDELLPTILNIDETTHTEFLGQEKRFIETFQRTCAELAKPLQPILEYLGYLRDHKIAFICAKGLSCFFCAPRGLWQQSDVSIQKPKQVFFSSQKNGEKGNDT